MLTQTSEQGAATAAPSPVEAAWLAGIFEGEGTVYTTKNGERRYTRLAVSMGDEDVVRRVREAARCGKVYGPYKNTKPQNGRSVERWNEFWVWRLDKLADIRTFLDLIRPHLGVRRNAKIDECLAAETRTK